MFLLRRVNFVFEFVQLLLRHIPKLLTFEEIMSLTLLLQIVLRGLWRFRMIDDSALPYVSEIEDIPAIFLFNDALIIDVILFIRVASRTQTYI